MNILIIGNGFDLAHKLPTKYTDFLDFLGNVRVLKEIHPEERKRLIRKIDKDMKQYLFTDENNFNINSKRSVYIDEIYQLLKDNLSRRLCTYLKFHVLHRSEYPRHRPRFRLTVYRPRAG